MALRLTGEMGVLKGAQGDGEEYLLNDAGAGGERDQPRGGLVNTGEVHQGSEHLVQIKQKMQKSLIIKVFCSNKKAIALTNGSGRVIKAAVSLPGLPMRVCG